MPPECGCSQDSTSESITGKWAGLLLFLSNPVSPTISHATAEYTPRRYIVNKKFEDLQVFLSSRNCRIWGGVNEAGNEGFGDRWTAEGGFVGQGYSLYSIRGNGIVSRTCSNPQIQATARSMPIPKPACGTDPNWRRSRYHLKASSGRWCSFKRARNNSTS